MGESVAMITTGMSAGGVAQNELDRRKSSRDLANARHENNAQRDDISNRREATYRADRAGIQGALDQYYKDRGWAVPERLPGYGTAKQLPFEKPLYTKEGSANSQPARPIMEQPDVAEEVAIAPVRTQPVEVQGLDPQLQAQVAAQPAVPLQPIPQVVDPIVAQGLIDPREQAKKAYTYFNR